MNKQIVNILWTGGWDSTYRIIELSRMNTQIQPIYVTGDNRCSEIYERKAMDNIVRLLKEHPQTKAVFLPILFIEKDSIEENSAITEAYYRVKKETNLGSQHEWLARYAYYHPNLEIGTEAGEPETSHIIDAIMKFGKLKKLNDTYILDKNESTEDGLLVLGNFSFPIIDKYETDMLANIQTWGYQKIMKEIWFCHNPIDGKPCGLCHPCAVKMESHMEFLLPEISRKRYSVQRRIKKILGIRLAEAICGRIYR